MIKTYGDKTTKKIMDREVVKGISIDIQRQCRRKLILMDDSENIKDIRVFRGNNLEKLQGTDFWSIRVNKQYRIIFKYDDKNYYEVKITKHYQ